MKIELILVFLERVSLGKMQDAKVFLYQILRKPTKENLTMHWQDFLDGWHMTHNVSRWKQVNHGHGAPLPAPPHATISQNVLPQDCIVKTKNIIIITLNFPASHDAVWFVCVCASRINLPTQNTMHTILNALLLACAESSIGSMQVGFIMALAGVPVRELFVDVGYWRRMRVPRARQWAENITTSDPGQTPKVI